MCPTAVLGLRALPLRHGHIVFLRHDRTPCLLLLCPLPCLPAVPLQELPADLSAEEHAFVNMLNEVSPGPCSCLCAALCPRLCPAIAVQETALLVLVFLVASLAAAPSYVPSKHSTPSVCTTNSKRAILLRLLT
jgi:hypothetical protein